MSKVYTEFFVFFSLEFLLCSPEWNHSITNFLKIDFLSKQSLKNAPKPLTVKELEDKLRLSEERRELVSTRLADFHA